MGWLGNTPSGVRYGGCACIRSTRPTLLKFILDSFILTATSAFLHQSSDYAAQMFGPFPGSVLATGWRLSAAVHGPGDRRKTSPVRLGSSVQLLSSDSLLKRKTFEGVCMEGATFVEKGKL